MSPLDLIGWTSAIVMSIMMILAGVTLLLAWLGVIFGSDDD